MGGAQAGEVASHLALDTLAAGPGRRADLARRRAGANDRVYRAARSDRARSRHGHHPHGRAAATATASSSPTSATAASTCGATRRLEQVTDDHSLVGEMVREGHLTREAALSHPQRSILSRALGTEPDVEVDAGELELRAGDAVLLCSDGLSSMVTDDTIAAVLAARRRPARAARRLVREAKNEGGHDNITVVVLRFERADGADGDGDEATLVPGGAAAVAAAAAPALADHAALVRRRRWAGRTARWAGGDQSRGRRDARRRPSGRRRSAGRRAPRRPVRHAVGGGRDAADGQAAAGEAPPPSAGAGAAAAPDALPAAAPRRRRRRRLWLAVVLVVVLCSRAVGGGAPCGVYFVGEHDGSVSVYRGVPVSGRRPRSLRPRTSRRPRRSPPCAPAVRARVERHDLHRKAAALALAARRRAVAVSRRNVELAAAGAGRRGGDGRLRLGLRGALPRARRDSVVTGVIFLVLFLVIHVAERRYLAQADPYLVPIAALLSAIGLTEIYRISPALA